MSSEKTTIPSVKKTLFFHEDDIKISENPIKNKIIYPMNPYINEYSNNEENAAFEYNNNEETGEYDYNNKNIECDNYYQYQESAYDTRKEKAKASVITKEKPISEAPYVIYQRYSEEPLTINMLSEKSPDMKAKTSYISLENNLTPSKSLRIYKEEASLKEDPKNNKETVDIFNKYLCKKMLHSENSSKREAKIQEKEENNEDLTRKKKYSPIVQDPLSLFEKKNYLKPSKSENIMIENQEKTHYSSKNSQKNDCESKTSQKNEISSKNDVNSKNSQKNEFNSKNSQKIDFSSKTSKKDDFGSKNSQKNDFSSKTSQKNDFNSKSSKPEEKVEKVNYSTNFSFKEPAENLKKYEEKRYYEELFPENKIVNETHIIEKKPENSERLKNMFIDSKSFFQKHHLKTNYGGGTFETRSKAKSIEKDENNGSLVWLQYQYENNKMQKATPESLLSSLKYRENKVFSYHENKLEIQDKSNCDANKSIYI